MKKAAYGHKTPHQARIRSQIVLLATRGRSNARIAVEVGVHVDTVRTWRGRFADGGLPALADRRRSGRPARFTPVQVAEAKALACQLPAETGVPLARWSCPQLAAELTARGITDTVSASTVRRWLRQDALKPWQYQSWIFIRDPAFRAKAQRILGPIRANLRRRTSRRGRVRGLQRREDLDPGSCRCHPALAPGRARAMRVNREYGCGGAVAYLAAYDVHQARVFGGCEASTHGWVRLRRFQIHMAFPSLTTSSAYVGVAVSSLRRSFIQQAGLTDSPTGTGTSHFPFRLGSSHESGG
ncbi:helix-turn-helix domain-containing protein [Streptomyces sp. NPDC058289]|uniref:helix-turn-helix domain-containing protein n=1 Tax=Streptomyces sp. NPDC058289 TaxID=3346425 RepID=UPI0036E3F70E